MDINFVKKVIKEILKKKFPNDSSRHELDETTSKKRIDIACPICGDSKTDSSKKRGCVYPKTKSYKCWNCGYFSSLNKFLLNTSRKLGINLSNYFTMDDINSFLNETEEEIKSESEEFFKTTDFFSENNPVIKQLKTKNIFDRLLCINDFKTRLNLIPINELKENTKSYDFLKNTRYLTEIPSEFTSNFIFADSTDSRIYSFNVDIKSKKVIGVTIRPISWKKYIICNYDKIIEDWFQDLKDKFTDDELVLLGNINQYWNILNIEFKETVFIAEGTFDYPFIKNALSLTGISKGGDLLNKISNYYVILDNDSEGISASMAFLKDGKQVFLWKKILSKYKKNCTGIQLTDLNKIKDVNDLFKWLNKYKKTNYIEFNKIILEYFSNNKFDLLEL